MAFSSIRGAGAYSATITAGGSAHTKGSFAELSAATAAASSRQHVECLESDAASQYFLFDLALGAAGAEVVVVENIFARFRLGRAGGFIAQTDIDIPIGSRVSSRCQSVQASALLSLAMILEHRALTGLPSAVTYGADLANTRGTRVDPGGTANAKGSYIEIAAVTGASHDTMSLFFGEWDQTNNLDGLTFAFWLVDVSTGAAGAEVVWLPDLTLTRVVLQNGIEMTAFRFAVDMPKYTRMACRCACTISTVEDRVITISGFGSRIVAEIPVIGPLAWVHFQRRRPDLITVPEAT